MNNKLCFLQTKHILNLLECRIFKIDANLVNLLTFVTEFCDS